MKKLVATLAVALLGAGIGAAYLWQQMDELRSQNDRRRTRVTALETRSQASAMLVSQPRGDTSAAPITAASTTGAPPPAATEATPGSKASDIQRGFLRASLGAMYPDLAAELGLTPDELEKFLDLLTTQRLSPTPDHKADEAAVAAMLGSRYPLWQEYQQTVPARQQVNQLRGQLAASGSTLSNAQARPLMEAINAEQKRIDQDAGKNPPPRTATQQQRLDLEMQRVADSNHRLVEAATPFLNAQQLDSYRRMLDQQIALGRSMMQVINATQEKPASK